MSVHKVSAAPQPHGAPAATAGGGGAPPDPAGELEVFLRSLLAAQCTLIGAAAGVVVLAGTDARRGGVVSRYVAAADGAGDEIGPDAFGHPAFLRRLERAGLEAVERAAAGAALPPVESVTIAQAGIYEASGTHRLITAPLLADGRAEGATVLLVPVRRRLDAEDARERLVLSAARFEAFLWRQHSLAEAQQKAMLRQTLELLDTSQQGTSVESMGSLLCHELQRRFGCTRVSVGLAGHGPIRLAAVSGADEIDRKGAAVGALEAAMEECADQDTEIVYPPPAAMQADPAQRRVTRSHESLARRFGPAAVLSLPLRVEGDLVGVATLERDENDPFPAASLPLLRLIAEFIGPLLWTRRLADRGVMAVARDRALDAGTMLVGPRHTGAKLIGIVAILTLVVMALPLWPKHVWARAEVRPAAARSIPSPFVGYLKSVAVKTGQDVREGQVLATMDTSDLEMELAELEARRASLSAEHDEAQANGDLGKAATLRPQIAEAAARRAFIEDHIARAEVRSPVTGTVSRGDLESFIGARVEPTQMLFEVVTQENIATVKVDERDIRLVRPGQAGTLTTAALPGEPVRIVVERVNPTADAVQGANVYLAEARIESPPAWLRPGQTGRATLNVLRDDGKPQRTSALSMLLGPVVDELRMHWWW